MWEHSVTSINVHLLISFSRYGLEDILKNQLDQSIKVCSRKLANGACIKKVCSKIFKIILESYEKI